ncbi:MAG: DUF1707 SHOCT-like domain-containing protein [Sciscionella sp.]
MTGDRATEFRVSDADRERTAELLQRGYATGRLELDEFSERLHEAYAARTCGQLAALTDDLPADAPRNGGRCESDRCVFWILLIAFPPAALVYWIVTSCGKK